MAKKISSGNINRDLRKLKSSGLVNIDLRKITSKSLEDKKQRKSFLATLRKFKSELGFLNSVDESKGKLSKVKNPEALEALESRGYRTHASGLVYIERKKNEKISVAPKTGNITYTREIKDYKTNKMKKEVIREPNINFKNINSVEEAVQLYADMYKGKEGRIAFTYYGNISRRIFGDVKDAIMEIVSYVQSQNEITTSLNPVDVSEIMKSVQLVEYLDVSEESYGAVTTDIKDKHKDFNTYFKKLTKKRSRK